MARIALEISDDATRSALKAMLPIAGHAVQSADDGADVIIADASGAAIRELLTNHPNTPLIALAAVNETSAAVEAMKFGATDFVMQPVRCDELTVRITRALVHAQTLRENQLLRDRVPTDSLAGQPLAEVEKKIILSTLQQFRGHRLKTASALGIGVRTLGMKLKRWRQEGELVEV